MNNISKTICANRVIWFLKRYAGRCVIFLGYLEQPNQYANFLKEIAQKSKNIELVVVNLNLVNPKGLDQSDIKLVSITEAFSASDYNFMDEEAYRLTYDWYKDLEKKERITEYKNIKLGELAEAATQQVFSRVVKNAHVVSWALDLFKPQNVVVIDELSDLSGVANFIESEYHIPSLRLDTKGFHFSLPDMIKQIKAKIAFITSLTLDAIMRCISLRLNLSNKNCLIEPDMYFFFADEWVRSKFVLLLMSDGLRIRIKSINTGPGFYIPVTVSRDFKYPIGWRRFSDYWNQLRSSCEFQDRFRYKDIRIWALVERELGEIFIYVYPQILRNIIFLERFYKRHSPKLIVLRDATREQERGVVAIAKSSNISTLITQGGAQSVKNVYSKIYSDKIAVWGPFSVKWYKNFGNDITRCVVTGSPKHDLFFEKQKSFTDGNKVYSFLGLDPNKKTILHILDFLRFYPELLAPSFFIDIERIVIEDLLNAIKAIPDTQLILKFHPFEYPDVWKKALTRYGNIKNVAVVKDFDFFQLIKISSLATTIFSTGGIEALLLGKPLICFNYFNTEEPILYGASGVALVVKESKELIPAIKKILEDKVTRQELESKRPAFVYDYTYKFDGQSSKRVLELMRRMYEDEGAVGESAMPGALLSSPRFSLHS